MQWFTSDTHFWHRNALRFRPFDSVEAMNEHMIYTWNRLVRPDDDVYHLGDLSFAGMFKTVQVVRQLNGRKHWILGNHDEELHGKASLVALFQSIQDYKVLKVTDPDTPGGVQRIVLSHFPMLSWYAMHRGSWMLHGHSHGSLKHPYEGMRLMDVGVDPNDFAPVSYPQVKAYMAGRRGHVCDQHEEKADA
ncbi:phosphoesterase [Cupriavidus campinensis]|uniref:Phosphoesterase n=1 Tax=Cupriavidus campinensis TaxID=151783 RepID=A0ABY3ETE3_9BURK|nr:phosphoesterase [Cupriavidus campinensis]TSP14051.1 phosphoesterase [Cupriavidus campinensis]